MERGDNSEFKIAYVFPGQGSQAVGMGRELYENSERARAVFAEADNALSFPLSKLCFEGPEDKLRETINSQPSILTVSVACLSAAPELNGNVRPAYVAGHSLGEYTALVAADALSFREAVLLVRERGRLMQEAGRLRPGSMAAILGLDRQSLDETCMETGAQIANVNCSGQIVISGTRQAVARSMDLARSRGATGVVSLQVSGAFHSKLMEPAVQGMAEAIGKVRFRKPETPIIANSTASPIRTVDEVKKELLAQLCHCVQWQPSVEFMLRQGISTFVEIGPGSVLTKLIKRISSDVRVMNMNDPESIRRAAEDLRPESCRY